MNTDKHMRGSWDLTGMVTDARDPKGYTIQPKTLVVRYKSDKIGKSLSIADEDLGILLQIPFDQIYKEITEAKCPYFSDEETKQPCIEGPCMKPSDCRSTTLVTVVDAFANSIPGYYDKTRELIFTPCGIIPTEKAFKKGYKIIEEEEQQRGEI